MSLVEKYGINIDFILGRSKALESPVITHYALTKESAYKKEAITETKEIIRREYSLSNITNIAAESAIEQWLWSMHDVPFPGPKEDKQKFTFIDLFAGIGGFRIASQGAGGKCVFSSEWDKNAQQTYLTNFGEVPFGDISKEETKKFIPFGFDILCGGFPCQPFSHAGLKKGFEDTRGTLFFDIVDILNRNIERKKPIKVVFLENVKGLKSHDKGNTFKTIVKVLEDLGYYVSFEVLNSKNFGLPQNRERIFIVAWLKGNKNEFKFPLGLDQSANVIFEKENLHLARETKVNDILVKNPDPKYTISDRLYEGHIRRKKEHIEKGNGFGFSLFSKDSKYTSTISARYYKDGSEILIDQGNKNPRKLTPREAANLQGYKETFIIPSSDVQAYRQFGNSVSVPVIEAIVNEIKKQLLCR